jgi:hypothetical protein
MGGSPTVESFKKKLFSQITWSSFVFFFDTLSMLMYFFSIAVYRTGCQLLDVTCCVNIVIVWS